MFNHKASNHLSIFTKLAILCISCFLAANATIAQTPNTKKAKKSNRADELLQKAMVLSDSAKYDSAIVLLNQACAIHKKKKNIEKYIHCRNEIVKQSRYLKFKDELLGTAQENLQLALNKLGFKHIITANSYSLLGNIFADINKTDSALFYFRKAKEIWGYNPSKNKMRIASADLNIGQMLADKGDFKQATAMMYRALKTKQDSLGLYHPDISSIYNSLGVLYYHVGNHDSCTISFSKVLEISKRHFGENHPQVANAYNNLGVSYKLKDDHQKALEHYQNALSIREKIYKAPHPNLALSYSNIGIIYATIGQYSLANDYYGKALKMRLALFGENHLDVAACYTNMGINCMDSGEGGSALLYIQKAFKIILDSYGPENPMSDDAYNNMGAVYSSDLGDYDKALKYFTKALELRLKTNENSTSIAGSYGNIGAVYKNKGDYALALSYYKMGLEILLQAFGEQNVHVASAYSNIGEAHLKLGEFDLAIDFFEKTIKIRQALFGESYPELSNSYLNLGSVYGELGKHERERECYEKGLEICLKNFNDTSIKASMLYLNMASSYSDTKDYEKAIHLLEKGLGICEALYVDDHPDIANFYAELGQVYLLKDNYELSEKYYNKALDANYIGMIPEKIDSYYVIDEMLFLETISGLADLYFKKYEKRNDIASLAEAVKYYQKTSEMVNNLESSYIVETSKLNLLNKTSGIFEKAIDASEALYQLKKGNGNLNIALNFSEQNKATVLYESMVKSKIDFENTSDSIWILRKDLLGKINYLKTKNLSEKSKSDSTKMISEAEGELSKLIVEYQHLVNKTPSKRENNYLEYTNKNSLTEKIQQHLKANELMLEFFVTDSKIYCFVIGYKVFNLVKTDIDQGLNSKLVDYISGIKRHRFNEFQDNSLYLYNILIKPVEKYFENKTKLVIIPDRQLLYLPFGSLIKQKMVGETDFSKLSYLVANFEIVYQYSANLWLENIQNPFQKKENYGFFGIAPFALLDNSIERLDSMNFSFLDRNLPDSLIRSIANSNNEFIPLPYSGKEIEGIAHLFEQKGINSKGVFGKNASEQLFKDSALNYKYIHIATHGIINNIHPELSGLAFRKGSDVNNKPSDKNSSGWKLEQNTDGILYAKEIFDLDLNADLVVMSACETGIGKLERGEGVISLTRGFLYSNISNILFSLWKINDKETCSLMTSFYDFLLKGYSYSGALRQAQLTMIKNKHSAFPSDWAAFSLVGL